MSWIGIRDSANSPNSTVISTAATTAIGRSIAKRIGSMVIPSPGLRRRFSHMLRFDRLSRSQPLVAPHHDNFTLLQAGLNLHPVTDRLPENNRTRLHLVILDDEYHPAIATAQKGVFRDSDHLARRAHGDFERHVATNSDPGRFHFLKLNLEAHGSRSR